MCKLIHLSPKNLIFFFFSFFFANKAILLFLNNGLKNYIKCFFLSSFYYQIQSVVYIHLTIPSNGICFIIYWTAPHKEKSSSSTVAARPYRDTQKLSPRFPCYLKSTCHKQLSPLLSLPKDIFSISLKPKKYWRFCFEIARKNVCSFLCVPETCIFDGSRW